MKMLFGTYIRAASCEQTKLALKRFLELEMGNFISLNISRINYEETLDVVDRLVKADASFIINGDITKLSPEKMKEISRRARGKYLGVLVVTEMGSLIYWDRDYFETLKACLDWKVDYGQKLFGARDVQDAYNRYMSICRQIVADYVIKYVGDTPNLIVDPCILQNCLMEIGSAFPCIELVSDSPELMIAAARGAARAFSAGKWMAYIPECYLGFENDVLRAKRFFLINAASYISGAGIILRESGAWRDRNRVYEKGEEACLFTGCDDYDTYFNDDYKQYRDISIAFYKFAQQDKRPAIDPEISLGILKGQLDGFVGMWDRRVWGQIHSPEWQHGDIEREWDYFRQLYHRCDWFDAYNYGQQDLSGNPPCGQVDIVPAEAPLKVWQQYKTLMFLGWNTMTDDLYERMISFVRGGGRLVMSLSHLRANIKRGEPLKLFRGGNFSELFGLKISGLSKKQTQGVRFIKDLSWCNGLPVWQTYEPDKYSHDPVCIDGAIQLADCKDIKADVIACATTGFCPDTNYPVIVENRIGQGSAVLISTWSTPGELCLRSVMNTLIRVVSAGQAETVKFSGSDRLRYSVYRQDDKYRIYILNTDYNNATGCKLNINGINSELLVEPCCLESLEFDKDKIRKLKNISYSQITG